MSLELDSIQDILANDLYENDEAEIMLVNECGLTYEQALKLLSSWGELGPKEQLRLSYRPAEFVGFILKTVRGK